MIYDPHATARISASTHQLAVDYNAFEGWEIRGRPDVVTVRGQVQVRDGQFVGRQDSRPTAAPRGNSRLIKPARPRIANDRALPQPEEEKSTCPELFAVD